MSDIHNDRVTDYVNAEARRARSANHEQNNGVNLDSILQIPVVLQVVVGSATLPVADLLKLERGAVVPLNSRVGDPVEVMINGREIARGEVVVVEDDHTRFGVSLTQIREPNLGHEQD